MDLLEQCQIWNENHQYQRIIDALEAIPAGERTPEMDSELARAYNNLAAPSDKAYFRRALALLQPHEAYFEGDHCWNFRMAYAYYYLDQEGPALHYFKQALEARPGDEDTLEFIEDCRDRLAMPRFEETFRQRTQKAWQAFAQEEADLRRMMESDRDHRRGEEIIHRCSRILHLAFEDISFELGCNGETYELVLTPEGDRLKLFELVYFQRQAPAQVLEQWSILVGRQPSRGYSLCSGSWEVSGDEVQVWVETLDEDTVGLTLYCQALLPLLREEADRAWWMLATLTDQTLGEIASMRCVGDFHVVDTPKKGRAFPLTALPGVLEEMGLPLSPDPQAYLHCCTSYQGEGSEDTGADWRMDILAGSTCCPPLLHDYLTGESGGMDALHGDGAAAGFLCYPLDGFEGEDSQAILAFRDALEQALLEQAGEAALTLTGGATGRCCGYVDFIAWDLPAVLDGAAAFFRETPLPWAGFHVFRREVATVRLLNRDGDGTGPEYYSQEEMEAVEEHIARYFGPFDQIWHELVSPDIHVDICLVPPTEERDYYTLVTMGMGAHRMNVPQALSDHQLERAELVIALPPYWRLDTEEGADEAWYWPIRLLKVLARLPIQSHTWLGWGHTMDNQEPFAQNTQLCGAMLIGPQGTEEQGDVCPLPNGEALHFYQVIPLYREEMDYKMAHDAQALLDRLEGLSFVVSPDRPHPLSGAEGAGDPVMDDGAWHLEKIRDKALPVEELAAFNHLAIYLRWCMEHDLMSLDFLERYGGLAQRFQEDLSHLDLRPFIQDELGGQLSFSLFDEEGAAFARWYYCREEDPCYPGDIEHHALEYFGPDRYNSEEFQDEEYLFVPFDEAYYQAMERVIQRRWDSWSGGDSP